MTLALSVLVARRLGPDQQGVQSYLMFVAMSVGTVFGLGLPTAVEHSISRLSGEGRPDLVRAFGRWAARSSAVPSVLSFLTVLVVGHVQYRTWVWGWVAAAVASSMVTLHATVSQGLNGLHEFKVPSGIGVTCQLAASLGCIAVLLSGGGVATFIAVQAAGMVASAGWTMREFLRRLPCAAQAPREDLVGARRTALRFAGVSGLVVLLETIVAKRSEFVFLALFHHDLPQEIAYYSVAFAAATAVAAVPMALNSVAMPVVARMIASGDQERVRLGYHSAQRLLLLIASPAAGGLLGCGGALVLLAYGDAYDKAAHLLLIATVAPLLAAPLGGLASASLLGAAVPGTAVRAQIVAAMVTVVADVVLIWPFASYGAAIAGGLGIVAGTWSLMVQARRYLGVPGIGADVWFPAFVTVVAVATPGALLTWAGMPSLVVLLAGATLGLVMLALAWLILKPLAPDHLDMLGSVLTRLPGSALRALDLTVSYQGRRRKDWEGLDGKV